MNVEKQLKQIQNELIVFKDLDSNLQHYLLDSLMGERVLVKLKQQGTLIELEGFLESKSLYLGEVAYDLRVSEDLRPVKVNLLYDIQEIKKLGQKDQSNVH